MPFGRIGTVTGIYKSKIEVLFDEPFIGGTDLSGRCGFFRGAVVDFLHIFNLSEWKLHVNSKKYVSDQIKHLYNKSNRGEQIHKYEELTEWDGKIDGMLLIRQIVEIKNNLTKARQQPQNQHQSSLKLSKNKEFIPTASSSQPFNNEKAIFSNQPFQQQQQYGRSTHQQFDLHKQPFQPQFIPISNPVIPAKFETNPKHRLKPKQGGRDHFDQTAEHEYVPKNKPSYGSSRYEEMDEYVPKKTTVKKHMDAKEAEQMMGTGHTQHVSAEDIEKQMAREVSEPHISTGVNIEDIERQMKSNK